MCIYDLCESSLHEKSGCGRGTDGKSLPRHSGRTFPANSRLVAPYGAAMVGMPLVTAMAACALPAIRASRIEPMKALRTE